MFTPFVFLSLYVTALALPGYQLLPGKQLNLPLGGGYQVFSPNQRNQPHGGGYQLFPGNQRKLPVGGGSTLLKNWRRINPAGGGLDPFNKWNIWDYNRPTGGGLEIYNKARDFAINQGAGTNQKNSYLPPWGISANLQKILGNKVKTQSPNSPIIGRLGNSVLDHLRRLGFNVNTQGGKSPIVGGRGFSFIDYLRQLGPKIVGKIGKLSQLLRRRQNYEIYRKLYLAVDRNHNWVVDEGEFLYFKTNQAEVASLLPFHRKADTEGLKGHPDSLLNFYEFQAAIKSLRIAVANGLYKVWFDKADKNKDGQILFDDEFEPYERARFYTNKARTSQEIYNEFRAIDLNKNGALTPDEYRVRLDNFFKHYE